MKDLLKIAYDAMDEKLASDLLVIDFRKQSPFLEYFIIGTAGTTGWLLRSLKTWKTRPWRQGLKSNMSIRTIPSGCLSI